MLLSALSSGAAAAQREPKRFRIAQPGYRFEFPRDHFSHPDFKTEWWYYTGNLKTADGRQFGFELTFFREIQILPRREALWPSPRSGAKYPLKWQLLVPGMHLDLEVRAAVPDQELVTAETTGVTYWEGAVLATGRKEGAPAAARGYLEMTGYAPGRGARGLRHLSK